ncbi:hypothetical protein QAD02_022163 [Eretmocerus hayati]|uniref:Uncharacterized protein n=1 Tax=Eretmocerus hayati TaxID=131215 RepID=A0ACC2PSU6_9HYME|nr:hypothetical protein QAD02_022163 [Eretmocerus hayati]
MPLRKKSTRNAARQREADRKRSLQESKERKEKWKKVVFKIPKVNSKKKVEEGLKRKRDGARFAREKLKENPIKYQEYLQAERDRYQNDVLTGKRKKRSELSERELTLVRRKDRERKRKERAKKKEVVDNVDPEAPSSSTDTTTEPIRKRRYKANKRQRTCYNENREYRQKNQVLTQKLDSTRKQLECLKNKKYPKSLNTGSPKSKTDAFLSKNPSLDAIRRELIFGEALKQDIRSRYKTTKKNAEKQYLTNLTRGKIIKKYRLMSEVKNNVTPAMQIRFRDESDYMSFKKKQKSHVENTKTSIEKFFVENSTIDPGKRAFKNRQQFSLHTGLAYSGLFNEGFTTISESLRHDAVAIMTHLKPILDHYLAKLPNVTELHVLSDGPTTQYKNRFAVYVITQFLLNLFPQIARFTWNFSEAGHGKGPADGIGATVKRAADDQVKYGADILDLSSLMTALEGKVPNVHIKTVSNSDITLLESKVDCDLAKSFNGITKVHQYTWSKEHPKRVFLNTLSCSACAPGTRCEHFCIDVSKVRKRKGDRCGDSDLIVVKKSKKVRLNQKPSTASLALTSNLRRTSR